MVLKANESDENLALSLTFGKLFVERHSIVLVSFKHGFNIGSHRLVAVADWIEIVRVPMLHKLFDIPSFYVCNRHHFLSVPKICAVLKHCTRLSAAKRLIDLVLFV